MTDDTQIPKHYRPEQVQQIGSCGQALNELKGLEVNGVALVAGVDKDVRVDGGAHRGPSIAALTASLSSRSTSGRPRSFAIHSNTAGCF